MKRPGSVLITGATGGIGAALALAYAAPSTTLILQGRREDRLADIAAQCQARGARVLTRVLDVRDIEAVDQWLAEVCAAGVPDLAIVNAGVNIHARADGQGEDVAEARMLIDVNVRAAMATVQGVLPHMRARRRGQVALISSLAAWRGLPETPSYSASKAALKAYGEAMRDAMAPFGVQFNVIMPGYVASPMCDAMPGPKPFLWQPARAAARIRRGLAANRARISFPFPLNFGCWLLAGIHPAVSGFILRRLGYRE
ncbi:short-chain dehydrogenase [Bordetella genomosp. 1]|uniref:Short-chain dehydrogenase n=1 Tax=Bordetella genomosp. 1 TaxID=1395607 RepID=A0A261SH76_9BORD|nr:SDR family NAD(P)-dependent oxidoreductase [Bordetella genomosp. 1]OZI35713.1 short-chain dehydrogenase [Bordetella genomosp. 1]